MLLNSYCRPYSEIYNPTNEDRYAVNVVDDSMVNDTWFAIDPCLHLIYSFFNILHFFLHIYVLSFCLQGKKKYLVLREIPEDGVKKLLANKESLASCDIAIIVHDRWMMIFKCLLCHRNYGLPLLHRDFVKYLDCIFVFVRNGFMFPKWPKMRQKSIKQNIFFKRTPTIHLLFFIFVTILIFESV